MTEQACPRKVLPTMGEGCDGSDEVLGSSGVRGSGGVLGSTGKSYLLCPDENGPAEQTFVIVKEAGFHLRRAVEEGDMKSILRIASDIIWELRKPNLSLQQYRNLYYLVCDEIKKFSEYMRTDSFPYQNKLLSLYEAAQHCGNLIPRLYLMTLICAEMVVVTGEQSVFTRVLNDLAFMATAVQNPLRGLYLRLFMIEQLQPKIHAVLQHYRDRPQLANRSCQSAPLSETHDSDDSFSNDHIFSKSEDPVRDELSEFDGNDGVGTLRTEIIDFLFASLVASNRLLTRLGYSEGGGKKGHHARLAHSFILQSYMKALSDTVADDEAFFGSDLCPKLLNLVKSLKDPLSQFILFDSLLRWFRPAHVLKHLGMILRLLFESSVHDLPGLLETLTQKFEAGSEIEGEMDSRAVDVILSQLGELESIASSQLKDLIKEVDTAPDPLLVSVPNLVKHWTALFRCYDVVTESALAHGPRPALFQSLKNLYVRFAGPVQNLATHMDQDRALILNDMKKPRDVEAHNRSVARVTETCMVQSSLISEVSDLIILFLTYGDDQGRSQIASAALRGVAKNCSKQSLSIDRFPSLIQLVAPHAVEDSALIALTKVVHKIWEFNSVSETFQLLAFLRAVCDKTNSGVDTPTFLAAVNPAPVLVGIVEACSQLILRRSENQEERTNDFDLEKSDYTEEHYLQFIHALCHELKSLDLELAFFCCLRVAALTDKLNSGSKACHDGEASDMDSATYEFLTTAIGIYEEQFASSKVESQMLSKLFFVFQTFIVHLTVSGYENLIERLCNHSCRLLRRGDQTSAILKCAHLFWKPPSQSRERVLECLEKAIKLAGSSGTSQAQQMSCIRELSLTVGYFRAQEESLIFADITEKLEKLRRSVGQELRCQKEFKFEGFKVQPGGRLEGI